MEDNERSLKVAVGLMRMALALLDKAEEFTGAARLQHTIDTVLNEQPLRRSEELSPEMTCLIKDRPCLQTKPMRSTTV